MLNFTKQKLHIKSESENKNIFYYDRYNYLEEIEYFSDSIHQDLKDYLGIQREMRLREKLSQAVTNEQKRYEEIKIHRINMFYDYYLDQVLQMMQMLYYENFILINEEDSEDFMTEFLTLKQTGLKLQQCFDKALELCEDIKLMIEKQIKKEYPVQTFSDTYRKK